MDDLLSRLNAAQREAVTATEGYVRVIAGAGSNSSEMQKHKSVIYSQMGASALLCISPYYVKTNEEGMYRHFMMSADAATAPIILYNVPSRTGCSFTAATYEQLSKHPNICGVKEASGNFALITETRKRCGDDFYIWSGNDDQVVPMMSLGAKGVISVVSNILPEVMVQMSHLCLDGKFEEAAKIQIETIDLCNALFMEVNPIPVKAAMEMMGLCSGNLRLPLCEMTPEHHVALREVLTSYGIALKN